MTEFYINGHRIELGKQKITQTFQINDIGEPKDRQLNYSFPFKIPDTPNNLKALEMLGVAGSISKTPYKQLQGKTVENGVEIISDGIVTVLEKAKNKFKAYIYGGNVYLFDAIGSKNINELSFSDLNHGVNLENFVNSFNNTEGYIYAISDFGKFNPNEIEINYQVPSLYVHTLWDKIFTEAGIKYYGDIFDTEKFRNKVITMQRGYNSEIDVISNPINITGTNLTNAASFPINHGPTFAPVINIIFPLQDGIIPDASGNSGSLIQIIDNTVYNFNFDIILTASSTDVLAVLNILKFNGVTTDVIYVKSLGDIVNGQQINVSGEIELEPNSQIIFTIRYGRASGESVSQTVNNFDFRNNQNFTSLRFQNFIGEMSQIAFVKDVMQEFGLIFQKRKNELAYDFIQIKTLISDRTQTLDWSSKFIGEAKEKYKLSKYAQSNIFAYNYLEDESIRFADGILKVANETLPTEKTLVVRPYNAPTLSDEELSGNAITYTQFWTIEFNDDGTVKGYKPFQSKNYIAEIKHINTTINYKLINGTVEQFTGQVPILDFSNLSYGQILTENYTELKRLLDFNNVKTVNLLLNELDIQNLDLFKTIFLEQYASDFYINKIRYTDSTKPSQVELVKIKRTASEDNQALIPSISINAFSSAPNSPFTFNWSIVTNYNIVNIDPVNATIKAKHYSDLPVNGGTPTGYELTDTLTTANSTHTFPFPIIIDEDKKGWYEMSVEQNGVESNKIFVEVSPVVVVPTETITLTKIDIGDVLNRTGKYAVQYNGFAPTSAEQYLQQFDINTQLPIGSPTITSISISQSEFTVAFPTSGSWKITIKANSITSNEVAWLSIQV